MNPPCRVKVTDSPSAMLQSDGRMLTVRVTVPRSRAGHERSAPQRGDLPKSPVPGAANRQARSLSRCSVECFDATALFAGTGAGLSYIIVRIKTPSIGAASEEASMSTLGRCVGFGTAAFLSLHGGHVVAGEIRVACYSDGNECEVTQDLAKRFEAQNADVKVAVDKVPYKAIVEQLPVQLAAGEGPDIARVTDLGGLSKYYLDITPYVKDPKYWEANFGQTLAWMRTTPGDKRHLRNDDAVDRHRTVSSTRRCSSRRIFRCRARRRPGTNGRTRPARSRRPRRCRLRWRGIAAATASPVRPSAWARSISTPRAT